MENEVATLSFVLTIALLLIMSFAMTYLFVKLIYVLTTHKLKRKIRQIDMSEYVVVDCFKGVPRTLQNKKNPNEIIYL